MAGTSPREQKRRELADYYGISDESTKAPEQAPAVRYTPGLLNIDCNEFDAETFISKLIKEKSLSELMDAENDIVQQVRRLDSEMQTLVYENYAKFIAATDTIRDMRSDFTHMESQMDALSQNMDKITDSACKVSSSLEDRRSKIASLAKKNERLKSFEYVLDLPNKLRSLVDQGCLGAAVKLYTDSTHLLEANATIPSLKSICGECNAILTDIKSQLRVEFRGKITSAKELPGVVELLIQAGDAPGALSEQFLVMGEDALRADLDSLQDQLTLCANYYGRTPISAEGRRTDLSKTTPLDILAFVDLSTSGFLSDAMLIVTSYLNLFDSRGASRTPVFMNRAASFLTEQMGRFFEVVSARITYEGASEECSILVRALDRLYRRVQATSKVLPDVELPPDALSGKCLRIITEAGLRQVTCGLDRLKAKLQNMLVEIRGQLATPKAYLPPNDRSVQPLAELVTKCDNNIVQWLKAELADLLQFTAHDVTFSSSEEFLLPFAFEVREKLVAGFFLTLVSTTSDLCGGNASDRAFVSPSAILVLSKICLTLEASTVGHLLDLSEQQFRLQERTKKRPFTTSTDLCSKIRDAAHKLLNRFVELEGYSLSQMLSKSVETRDWVSCMEPRAVRAVMKRVVEDVSAIDARVGQLYEEGSRRDRSSDSSRHTGGMHSLASRQTGPNSRGQWNLNLSESPGENPLLRKLWCEKIEYFAFVEPSRVSIVTGIIKICLKTLLECVRIRSFGKFGFQQVQVDAHYLQLYLWRFVADENLVHHLLEEIMSSAVVRCFDPQLMEPSVVEMICERG